MFGRLSAPNCQEHREEFEPLLDEARYLFLDEQGARFSPESIRSDAVSESERETSGISHA